LPIKVLADTVDEWYGVCVEIGWADPDEFSVYAAAMKAEEDSWWSTNRNRAHVGPWPLEQRLMDSIVGTISISREWEAFYAVPRRVQREEYEDGPMIHSTIPKFGRNDFSDWEFTRHGGWLSATRR
jgi:hypothetical protein